jgi:hypothetical protein
LTLHTCICTCQMVLFQAKNPNLGNFWRVLKWKMLIYFIDIWSILQPFGTLYEHFVCTFCGNLVYFPPFVNVIPRKIWQPWYMLRVCHETRGGTGFWAFYILNKSHVAKLFHLIR